MATKKAAVKKAAVKKAAVKKAAVKKVTKPSEITVTVCELMKDLKQVKVAKDSTVGEVLSAAGINTEGKLQHLRINGEIAVLKNKVFADDIITLVPTVNGG